MRLIFAFVSMILALPAAARDLPDGFVYLRDVAPGIAQEIRYATPHNFTARTLPGYDAGECVLRREAAQALAKVAADLAREHLALKTYDCYRPERAVRAFWRWAHDGKGDGDKSFYPNVDKRELFSLGYIAAQSKHSTGTAVDITLVPLDALSSDHSRASGTPALNNAPNNAPSRAPCTAPSAQRTPDDSLDMGTGFDCLDVRSYTRSAAVTPAQRQAREKLRAAMTAHGFRNYFREWWHYEYAGAPQRPYDFPIEKR